MYPLGLCAFCMYGPKVVREAASLLSLCVERMSNLVGGESVRLRMFSSPPAIIHYSLFISGLRSKRSGFIIHYSFGAEAL